MFHLQALALSVPRNHSASAFPFNIPAIQSLPEFEFARLAQMRAELEGDLKLEHVTLTKAFLNNPALYLKHL